MYINLHPFTIQTLMDYSATAYILVHTGYLSYKIISKKFTQKHYLIILKNQSNMNDQSKEPQIRLNISYIQTRIDMGTL